MQHGYFKSLLNVLKMAQKHQEPGKTYAAICKKTGILSLYRRGMMFCRFFMFKNGNLCEKTVYLWTKRFQMC